jgi:hypothetical protein
MSPLTHDLLKCGLFAVFISAFGTCFWANGRMMRRGRDSGYGLFDPRRTLAGASGIEPPIFFAAVIILATAGKRIAALH